MTVLFSGTACLLLIPLLSGPGKSSIASLGLIFSIGTFGSILSGIFISRSESTGGRFTHLGWFVMLQAFGLILIVCAQSWVLAAIGKFILDFAMTTYFRASTMYLQAKTTPGQFASFFHLADATSRALGLVGIILGGWAFDHYSPPMIFGFLAAALMLVGLFWLMTSPARSAPSPV